MAERCRNSGNDRSADQHENHWVEKLLDKPAQDGFLFRLLQPVFTVARKALRGLSATEAVRCAFHC